MISFKYMLRDWYEINEVCKLLLYLVVGGVWDLGLRLFLNLDVLLLFVSLYIE